MNGVSEDSQPKMGRPSSYKAEYARQAAALANLGATDAELADFFEVSTVTIWRWRNTHVDFCNALKAAKEAADNRVERSLYQKAVGYSFSSEKIFMPAGAKEPIRAPIVEHVPPSETAMIFWLKNRRKAEWRDKQEHGFTDAEGKDLNFAVQLVKAKDS